MKDLTKGNIYKNFILFAIPLVLSGLLTQAFNVINGMLSGNYLGEGRGIVVRKYLLEVAKGASGLFDLGGVLCAVDGRSIDEFTNTVVASVCKIRGCAVVSIKELQCFFVGYGKVIKCLFDVGGNPHDIRH